MQCLVPEIINKSSEYKLKIEIRAKPLPDSHQVLIAVKAFGLNRADLLQIAGFYPAPTGASDILGLECAGIIEAVGTEVKTVKVGDRVAVLVKGGAYAEFCLAEEYHCMNLDPALDFTTGASIPEAWITAYQGLMWLAKIQPKERVLIHAAASGVGLAAIQIARQLGTEVFATSSAEKKQICLSLGCSEVFDKGEQWAQQIEKSVGEDSMHTILEFVGPKYFEQDFRALSKDGRIILLGLLGGGKATAELDYTLFLRKRAVIKASTLRSRSKEYVSELLHEFWRWGQPRFINSVFKPIIDKVYEVHELPLALNRMHSNQNIGKILVHW